LFTSGLNKKDVRQKEAFYELENNPKIDRRVLPNGMAKRFHILLSSDNDIVTNQIRALVLDDTAVVKIYVIITLYIASFLVHLLI